MDGKDSGSQLASVLTESVHIHCICIVSMTTDSADVLPFLLSVIAAILKLLEKTEFSSHSYDLIQCIYCHSTAAQRNSVSDHSPGFNLTLPQSTLLSDFVQTSKLLHVVICSTDATEMYYCYFINTENV